MLSAVDLPWSFTRFGLFVTGKGEEQFIHHFFKPLLATGRCSIEVIAKIGQRSPLTAPRRQLKMLGSGKLIADRDQSEIGIKARQWLNTQRTKGPGFVILLDDVESDRANQLPQIYARYRLALDTMLGEQAWRAAVHFFRNMLEAYYLADVAAVVAVLGPGLTEANEDVEVIRHPKNKLKAIYPQFDEVRDGAEIASRLDLERVLSCPTTCATLRTLYAWCFLAMGFARGSQFCLDCGSYDELTAVQLNLIKAPA